MAFFFNDTKTEAKKPTTKARTIDKRTIPIASLNTLSCSVCPRDTDKKIKTPKMRPSGTSKPLVYLLGSAPSKEDDAEDTHWLDEAHQRIYDEFGEGFMKQSVRSNYVTQCHSKNRDDQTVVEIECCRLRIVSDIEATKPLIIVGVGDKPLEWATGITGHIMHHRGTLMVVKIGTHVCWFVPILYPNFVYAKSKYNRRSEYEITLIHDIKSIMMTCLFNERAKFYPPPYDTGVEIITGSEPGDMQRLEQALRELALEPKSTVDIETNGLRPYFMKDPHIWTAAVGTFRRTVAFPVDHPDGWGTDARKAHVRLLLGQYLLASGRKACHHLGFEMEWFSFFYGPDVLRLTEWDDTMAIAHTVDERNETKSLGYQTQITFGFDLKKQSTIDVKRLLEYPIKDVLRYNGMDTKWTDKLRDTRMPELHAAAHPAYFREYERKVRLAPTLVLTEAVGLPINYVYAQEQDENLRTLVKDLEGRIQRTPEVKKYTQRYGTFIPSNADQVLVLMKDICDRSEVRVDDFRTGVVRLTTDDEAMSKIPADEVPSAEMILEHRTVSKIRATYIKPIIEHKFTCPDGRIRPKYSSMRAVTGRLAAEDPVIQNWPVRLHKEVRGIISTEKERRRIILGAFDYGQIEFRTAGMASEDRNLVKYCWTQYDVHMYWAKRIVAKFGRIKDYIVKTFNVDWDEKGLKLLRQETKSNWVFAQIFGAIYQSCAAKMHIPESIAAELAEEFWDEFADLKKWQDGLLKKYEKNLYVETLTGRRRRGPMTRNEIINDPIQGTAADIVLEAMCALSERSYTDCREDLQPALNVHDDLTFLLEELGLDATMDLIATEMCKHRFAFINVPLVVEAKVGIQWHALEEVKVYRSDELFNLKNPYK